MTGQETITIKGAYTELQSKEKAMCLESLSGLSIESLKILKQKIDKKGTEYFSKKIIKNKNLL